MRKIAITLTYVIFIALQVFSQNPNPSSEIDSWMLEEMNNENLPGVTSCIVKDGEVVWLESYGYANVESNIAVNDETPFMIASASKLFTGTAAMQLVEAGQLLLDENINTYLPFEIKNPNYPDKAITLRMLLTHSSSISDNEDIMDTYYSRGTPAIPLAECIERYFSTTGSDYDADYNFLDNEPGTFSEYSNIATALVGYIVQVTSGQDFSAYCKENIFTKICMNKTAWFISDLVENEVAVPYNTGGSNIVPYERYEFADYPDGQLYTTAKDVANFMITYLQGGILNSTRILKEETINQMWKHQIPSLSATQGLSWYGEGNKWGHEGSEDGVMTTIELYTDTKIGVAVFTNGENDVSEIVKSLYNYALTLNTSGIGNPTCILTQILKNDNSSDYKISPNPINDIFTISGNEQIKTIVIINSNGETLMNVKNTKSLGDFQINIEHLPKGTYLVKIITENESYIKKIVKL